MKKTLTTTFLIWAVLSSFAQLNRTYIPDEVFDETRTRTFHFSPAEPGQAPVKESAAQRDFEPTSLGETYHDFFTYGAQRQQVYAYPDGYRAAVWTHTEDSGNEFSDMGTCYSYSQGGSDDWNPDNADISRLEDHKARFPCYAPWGENGEIIVSQQENGINIFTRTERGAGEWQHHILEPEGDVPALKLPHMITSGENHQVIHLAVATNETYGGQKSALLYFRSQDGGQSWDQQSTVLEGTGSEHYTAIYGDTYNFAVSGDTVALAVSSPWHDTFYLLSEDNGESWEKHVVWEHPAPMFDFETTMMADTVWCPDGSLDAIFDENGNLHLAFGLTRVAHPETGYDFEHFLWTDGIVHWNETMEPFVAPDQNKALSYEFLLENETLAGWAAEEDDNNILDNAGDISLPNYPFLGLSTMPSFTRQESIYALHLSYSSVIEDYIDGENFYRKLLAKTFFHTPDNPELTEWSALSNITNSEIFIFDEFKTPQGIPVRWSNWSSYVFLTAYSSIPGITFENQNYLTNIAVLEDVFTVTNPLLDTSIPDNQAISFTLHQNLPNPVDDVTEIIVSLRKADQLNLRITDAQGRIVMQKGVEGIPGKNRISVSAAKLTSGIYYYTVSNNSGEYATRKMIVK